MADTLAPSMFDKNNHKLEGWNTSMNELSICWKMCTWQEVQLDASCAQNGAKVSYSPARQSKISHLLPPGRMVNRSQNSPSGPES